MGRRKRTAFGDVSATREAFERSEVACPNCHHKLGPSDQVTFVRSLGGRAPTLATMRCGRCTAELTVHFLEAESTG